jgi:hypothetical protein
VGSGSKSSLAGDDFILHPLPPRVKSFFLTPTAGLGYLGIKVSLLGESSGPEYFGGGNGVADRA